jgi:hypothetical protein
LRCFSALATVGVLRDGNTCSERPP